MSLQELLDLYISSLTSSELADDIVSIYTSVLTASQRATVLATVKSRTIAHLEANKTDLQSRADDTGAAFAGVIAVLDQKIALVTGV